MTLGDTFPSISPILNAIWSRLSTTAVYTNIGGRIYMDSGPQDAQLPLLVYRSNGLDAQYFFGGQARLTGELEFTFHYANKAEAAMLSATDDLSKSLQNIMSATGFDRVRMYRISAGMPAFADDAWSITDRYRLVAHAK